MKISLCGNNHRNRTNEINFSETTFQNKRHLVVNRINRQTDSQLRVEKKKRLIEKCMSISLLRKKRV